MIEKLKAVNSVSKIDRYLTALFLNRKQHQTKE